MARGEPRGNLPRISDFGGNRKARRQELDTHCQGVDRSLLRGLIPPSHRCRSHERESQVQQGLQSPGKCEPAPRQPDRSFPVGTMTPNLVPRVIAIGAYQIPSDRFRRRPPTECGAIAHRFLPRYCPKYPLIRVRVGVPHQPAQNNDRDRRRVDLYLRVKESLAHPLNIADLVPARVEQLRQRVRREESQVCRVEQPPITVPELSQEKCEPHAGMSDVWY